MPLGPCSARGILHLLFPSYGTQRQALELVELLLKKGSPRWLVDVHARMPVFVFLTRRHPRAEVRGPALRVYMLSNRHRSLEWDRAHTAPKCNIMKLPAGAVRQPFKLLHLSTRCVRLGLLLVRGYASTGFHCV